MSLTPVPESEVAILSFIQYAIYHGPDGLKQIAHKVHAMTSVVAAALEKLGHEIINPEFFDTLTVGLCGAAGDVVHQEAVRQRINLRKIYGDYVGITFDERWESQRLCVEDSALTWLSFAQHYLRGCR